MAENIVITNPEKLKKIKKGIAEGGAEKLHILSDFDRTLTTAFIDGKNVPSLISILRDGNYLTSDYSLKAQALYDKYHQVEINLSVPAAEKKKAMQEWWEIHFNLLIKSRLNKKDIERAVDAGKVKFRDGFGKFIDFLKTRNIPLVIISSSGLGADAIKMYLEKEGKLYENVYIISNSFEWNKEGYAVAVKKPIIHGMNKDETLVRDFPVFETIKERKNVLLLGDSLDDVGMVVGFDAENLIKIAFLNEEVEDNLEPYKKAFDAVILNDGSMEYVNSLLKSIML